MSTKKIIYIIVVIVILLLGLICTLSLASSFLWKEQNVEVKATTRANQPLELEGFSRINGTKYLLAEITAERTETFIGSSSGSVRGEVRNLVFLDSESLSSHRLFETNSMVILGRYQYPKSEREDAYYVPPPADTIVRWMVYKIVKEDTNGDGEQNNKDRRTIAVSGAGGTNYVELLHDIDEVSGMVMVEEGQLVIVYKKDGVTQVSILDLENREVIDTQKIVSIDSGTK